ncbi:hypothetical protein AUJ14_01835 [Candidatus Micrarchaeota archaeon CG1_02_55_22]|nr:MAG: hypothetical protein AUJ14_01835 [Candidatus Micrarchaeota archaeon CG1_02_55_22]
MFAALASGATIYGTVYSPDLTPLPAVVSISTVPVQQAVAANGTYSFNAAPGTYELMVAYNLGNESETYREKITVPAGPGEYRRDILVIGGDVGGGVIDIIDRLPEAPAQDETPASSLPWLLVAVIAGGVTLAVLFLYYVRRKPTPSAAGNATTQENVSSTEELKVLSEIGKSGGLITQKELRKRLPYSEARISMVLTSLEASGRIKKIKRGRGNLIKSQA